MTSSTPGADGRFDPTRHCIVKRCFAPVACGGFGYCRERNAGDIITTPEMIELRRLEQAQRASPAPHDAGGAEPDAADDATVAVPHVEPASLTRADAIRTEASKLVALWMIGHGYATGHGDTLDDLLTELEAGVIRARSASAVPQVEPVAAKVTDEDTGYWRSIDTAPKDGTLILLWRFNKAPNLGRWALKGEWFGDTGESRWLFAGEGSWTPDWWAPIPPFDKRASAFTAPQPERAASRVTDEDGWQPIATAPRDGTTVDLLDTLGFRRCDMRWITADLQHELGWRRGAVDDQGYSDRTFSHWRALPVGPNGRRPVGSFPHEADAAALASDRRRVTGEEG